MTGYYEDANTPVKIRLVGEKAWERGTAEFSKSGKSCTVWYDDSSSDDFRQLPNGNWKISGLKDFEFIIEKGD